MVSAKVYQQALLTMWPFAFLLVGIVRFKNGPNAFSTAKNGHQRSFRFTFSPRLPSMAGSRPACSFSLRPLLKHRNTIGVNHWRTPYRKSKTLSSSVKEQSSILEEGASVMAKRPIMVDLPLEGWFDTRPGPCWRIQVRQVLIWQWKQHCG